MAQFKSIIILITITTYLSHALYEDQVGKFDWKISFIGKVKFAKFENNRIVAATDENILAALRPSNGKLIWKQTLEAPPENSIELLHTNPQDKEIVTVSGTRNNWFVRGWDLNSGVVLWEWTIFMENTNSYFYWFIKDNQQLVHVTPVWGSHLEVSVYELRTGSNNGTTSKISTPWLMDHEKCVLAPPYLSCINGDDTQATLKYLNILSESGQVYSNDLMDLIGEVRTGVEIATFDFVQPIILLKKNKNLSRLLAIHADDLQIRSHFDIATTSVGSSNQLIFQLDVDQIDKVVVLRALDWQTQKHEFNTKIDYPLGLGAPFPLAANCNGDSCQLLVLGSDNSLSLIDVRTGNFLWTKEEALSHIVATEFFELPVSELDASIETEFAGDSNDVLNMFIHRITTQFNQLTNYLLGGGRLEDSGLVRDEFGLHKIIVVATKVGKLFGIDTITGRIIWSYRLPIMEPFLILGDESIMLLVQRTARYAPLAAQAVLLAKDSHTGNGLMFQFDPIKGLPTQQLIHFDYKIKQAFLLPHEDENHIKPLLIVTEENKVEIHPSSAEKLLPEHVKNTFVYTVEPTTKYLRGYRITSESELSLMWEMNLGPSQIVSLSMRPVSERVHSQGRVLADRSVYYKYVNPNLLAVATLADDTIHKKVLSVYLIDGISGLVLYATSHKRVKGPIHLVHSENWLVYSYFSERFRRQEIAAAELFEGHIQSNSSVFSSFAVSQLPHVQTQSYIIPAFPQTMTVTLTERGITNKFLLVALSNGAIVEIPWFLLQPRFSDLCGPEENCIPYMPEIPLSTEGIINYNQTLSRIRKIEVAPARLESTTHVLVHGLDMFYTRVAPSKQFDVLKEDFDHKLIVLVLTGLIVASYLTKYLASKKALRQLWK